MLAGDVALAGECDREAGQLDFGDATAPATEFFGIPGNRLVELGVHVAI